MQKNAKKTQKKRKKNAKKRAKIPGKISGKSPEKWKKVSKVSNFWGVPAPTAKGGWTPLFLGAHPTTTTWLSLLRFSGENLTFFTPRARWENLQKVKKSSKNRKNRFFSFFSFWGPKLTFWHFFKKSHFPGPPILGPPKTRCFSKPPEKQKTRKVRKLLNHQTIKHLTSWCWIKHPMVVLSYKVCMIPCLRWWISNLLWKLDNTNRTKPVT